MSSFDQLPQTVQDTLLAPARRMNKGDYYDIDFAPASVAGVNGVWAAPHLCYDFHESNYSLIPVNLTERVSLDVGPAMASLYTKTDPSLPAWFVVESEGDVDSQLIECV